MRKASRLEPTGFSNPNDRGAIIRAKYIVINGIKVDKDYENFVPETFGRLTTIGPRFRLRCENGTSKYAQVCQCDDGTIKVVLNSTLRRVGVSRKQPSKRIAKQGWSKHPAYNTWQQIRQRCNNPGCHAYPLYGAMGVTVCPEWLDKDRGFTNFVAHMGPKPGPGYTVDRHPNPDGNYEPGNVRWATKKEQANNRRNNRMLTAFGKTQSLTAWAEERGMRWDTLQRRLGRGWSLEKSLTEEVEKRKPRKKKNDPSN